MIASVFLHPIFESEVFGSQDHTGTPVTPQTKTKPKHAVRADAAAVNDASCSASKLTTWDNETLIAAALGADVRIVASALLSVPSQQKGQMETAVCDEAPPSLSPSENKEAPCAACGKHSVSPRWRLRVF